MIENTVDNNLAAEKIANTDYPIAEILKRRWSPVSISNRSIDPEKLCQVLEAARWAASSFNEQPWSFIVATQDNPLEFDRLLSCLAEGNQEWARNAPVLMLSVAKLYFERNGSNNPHALHDVGAAEANLAVQATELGLVIHQMAGFDGAKARELYSIPEGYEPVTAIALGYLGNPDQLSEQLHQRELAPRTRKPLNTFVFSGRWQEPSPLIR